MRLFWDRFLRAAVASLLIAVALSTLLVVIELVDQVHKVNSQTSMTRLLWYIAGRTMTYVYQFGPVATLLAAVSVANSFARRGENLAAQALGYSPARLLTPYIAWSVLVMVMLWWIGASFIPRLHARLANSQRELFGRALYVQTQRPYQWFQIEDALLYLPHVSVQRKSFIDPVIYVLDDEQRVAFVLEGAKLEESDGGWDVHKPVVHRVLLEPELALLDKKRWDSLGNLETTKGVPSGSELRLPLAGKALSGLLQVSGVPQHTPSRSLSQMITNRRAAGLDDEPHRQEMLRRWVDPMLSLWLMLSVATWLFYPGRSWSLAMALVQCVGVVGVVFAASQCVMLFASPYLFGAQALVGPMVAGIVHYASLMRSRV